MQEVELVRPKDMLIGPYERGKCGCVAYWRHMLLPQRLWFRHAEACRIAFGASVTGCEHEGIVTKKDAADMHNHGLHAIGFTENNPPLSAKRIAELRRKMTGEVK